MSGESNRSLSSLAYPHQVSGCAFTPGLINDYFYDKDVKDPGLIGYDRKRAD
jgi:hypothetical protein